MLRVYTFGRPHVRGSEGLVSGSAGQPRRLAILALLATAGEQGLTREKVMAYLWPEAEEDRARRSLNQAIYALRQDLGSEDALLGTRDLRLNRERVSSDLAEFEQALAEGRREDAAVLYTGPFLDGFHLPGAPEFESWVEEERAELARNFADLLAQLGRRAEERGDHEAAVRWWRRLAAQDPLNARVAKVLMQALVAAGDRPGALQHARIYEALVEQELDLPPDREVIAFADELKRAEAANGASEQHAPVVVPAPALDVIPPPTELPATPPPEQRSAALEVTPSTPAPPPIAATAPASTGRSHRRAARSAAVAVVLAGALMGGLLVLRDGAPPSLVPGTTRRVAFADALELHPAISADGKTVAYAAEAGDRMVIFVQQVQGGRAVPVSEALPGLSVSGKGNSRSDTAHQRARGQDPVLSTPRLPLALRGHERGSKIRRAHLLLLATALLSSTFGNSPPR
jgi:DNA-binding SARP family transcriptional activator